MPTEESLIPQHGGYRKLKSFARAFENERGFTERLYRIRQQKRRR